MTPLSALGLKITKTSKKEDKNENNEAEYAKQRKTRRERRIKIRYEEEEEGCVEGGA